jgi:hypothetical protein
MKKKGSGGIAPPFWTSALDRGEWLASYLSFTPKTRAPGTHWIGIWLDLRAVLEFYGEQKNLIIKIKNPYT